MEIIVHTNIVLTFIGDDHPGLIDQISKVVGEHQGNWLESRLSRLAGKFSGIIHIAVDQSRAADLTSALEGLSLSGLSVLCERCDDGGDETSRETRELHVLGLDRSAIIQEVSHALASQQINVTELFTDVFPAPMTGELMFNAQIIIELRADTNLDALEDRLERISEELSLDIELLPDQT
jgi:glycine cleavage system regulatory protein